MAKHILIIDDEQDIRASLRGILEDEGYTVYEAPNAEDGVAFLEGERTDLVFLDIWLPGMDGIKALEIIHAQYPFLPVVMISGHGTIETAVTAIKKGAHDFIEKPLSLEKVLLSAERALELSALRRENTDLRERLDGVATNSPMGSSPVMVQLREQIGRVAPLDTWVLITGENGTGKELVARSVHLSSNRKDMPLVAVNCAAIPEELIESELFGHEKGAFTGADSLKVGKFEMANQGTLFLDEIGDMSLKTQAKILRILQEKTFERVGGNRTMHADVRVIAATNKNLEAAIKAGEFREDLYYRLKVFPLYVHPLRERDRDALLLADFFTATLAQDLGLAPMRFSERARDAILAYPWPGNVRELRNFIERMLILHSGCEVALELMPPEFQNALAKGAPCLNDVSSDQCLLPGAFAAKKRGDTADEYAKQGAGDDAGGAFALPQELPADFKSARSAFEAHFLAAKLEEYGGNISRLAEAIGLERSYLYRKLKTYNIQGSGETPLKTQGNEP